MTLSAVGAKSHTVTSLPVLQGSSSGSCPVHYENNWNRKGHHGSISDQQQRYIYIALPMPFNLTVLLWIGAHSKPSISWILIIPTAPSQHLVLGHRLQFLSPSMLGQVSIKCMVIQYNVGYSSMLPLNKLFSCDISLALRTHRLGCLGTPVSESWW